MIKCGNWPIGVCTWSLGNDLRKIKNLTQQTGISHIHLALGPALTDKSKSYLTSARNGPWTVTATMIDFPQEDYSCLDSIKATGGIIPDLYWPQNRQRVLDAVRLTSRLGVKYLTFHFGFIDLSDADYAEKIRDRAKQLAEHAAEKNVHLLMETGQETAVELRHFLEQINHPALGVNFDPANMILYDKGDPIKAVHTLAPYIKHIHIKDALPSWGREVPWGSGNVNTNEFLKALKQIDFTGALAIEREAADNPVSDIKTAINALAAFTG